MKFIITLLVLFFPFSLYAGEEIIEVKYLHFLKTEAPIIPISSLNFDTPFCSELLLDIKSKKITGNTPITVINNIDMHESKCNLQEVAQFTQIESRHWNEQMLKMSPEELKPHGSTFTPFDQAVIYKGDIDKNRYTFLVNSCYINTQVYSVNKNYEPVNCRSMGVTYLTVIDEKLCKNYGNLQTLSYHNYNNSHVGIFDYKGKGYIFSKSGNEQKRTLSIYSVEPSKRKENYSFVTTCKYSSLPNKKINKDM